MSSPSDIIYLHPKFSVLPEADREVLFDPEKLKAKGLVTNEVVGRGTTCFFTIAGNDCVLRHYWRGGLMRRFSKDAYFWTGIRSSRSFREWQILEAMEKFNLPAPRRLALRIQRSGLFYRSDIVTEEIPDSEALGTVLVTRPLEDEEWRRIGKTISEFHNHGVFHQDLNANNLLLSKDTCYLIDFDRGRLMGGDWWKSRMLNRLNHSLEKLSGKHSQFHFGPVNWETLMEGYRESN